MSLTSTMSLLADLLDPPEIERDVQPFPKWLPRNFPSPDWVWNKKHLVLIQKELMAMHAGDYSHLLILLPPRHGKSEQVTVRWPAWNLELDPKKKIIVGAYNKDFASTFSGEIRRLVSNIPSIRISKENKRRADWKTADGGGVVAAGVGSAPTGRGGDILIIDDPVKNRKEANSITYRNDVWNWFLEDMYTRREPGAQTIVIMTQWHDDDLAGRLMTRGAWRGVFKVLRIPALAETQEERDLYHGRFESLEVGVPDPVGRKPGAPLWKERFNKKMLEKIRLRLGRAFSALYQQRPQPVEGGQFKRSWFSKIIPNVPLDIKCTFVRYWDKAGTEDGGKYTAGVLIMHLSGLFYIVDVVRGQWGATKREEMIKSTAISDRQAYGKRVKIWIEQEPGSGGKESAENTIKNLAREGIKVKPERPTGQKSTRAEPFEAALGAGLVSLVVGDWNGNYIEEHVNFEEGANFTDQVDGSSGAFNKLAGVSVSSTDLLKGELGNLEAGVEDRW